MASAAISVKGMAELNRAFERAGRHMRSHKKGALIRAAEPVRTSAEALAVARIRRIGPRWSQMRIGVTSEVVYVAPLQRGTRILARKRRALAPILLERSMEPALEGNRDKVVAEVEKLLDRLEGEFNRG